MARNAFHWRVPEAVFRRYRRVTVVVKFLHRANLLAEFRASLCSPRH